jgi:hypothetical protein
VTQKRRLSASVDAELLNAAEAAAKRGDAPTLSAWITDAIQLKLENDSRLEALAAYFKEYEAEFGPITAADMEAAKREAKRRAISVRGLRAGESRRRYGR